MIKTLRKWVDLTNKNLQEIFTEIFLYWSEISNTSTLRPCQTDILKNDKIGWSYRIGLTEYKFTYLNDAFEIAQDMI